MDPRGEQNAGEKFMGIISIHEMAVTLLGKWAHNSCTKKSYSFIHSFANNHWASNMCSAQMKFMSRWGWQEVTDKSAMKEIDTQWNGVIGEGVDKKGLLEEVTLEQISGEKESVMQRAEEHSRQRNSNSEAWGGKTLAKTVNGQQCLRGRGWVPRWGPTQSQHAQSVIMVDTRERKGLREAGRGLWDFKFHSEGRRKPTEEAAKAVTSEHLFREGFGLCRPWYFCAVFCSIMAEPQSVHKGMSVAVCQ